MPTESATMPQLELVKGKIEKPSHAGASKDVADCLAAVVHHVEEGWRKGMGSRGMFQIGLVEGFSHEPDAVKEQAVTNVVRGKELTVDEERALLFGDLEKP